MRNHIPPEDSAHSGSTPTNPPNPVQELRITIGKMADCLTRMLDALHLDRLELGNVAYLTLQAEHLADYFEDMDDNLEDIRETCDHSAANIAEVDAAEIVELSGIPAPPIVKERGAS